ncbi:hypothetical protein [Streptomyces sp. NPDC096339]|uniref:hypothetical protein n=1 Tax=Streptomyces sp. NPDC096339 TaxID=3366086 RepID=UPI0037F64389
MPKNDAARVQRGTIALFIAAAVLAVVGSVLLFGGDGTQQAASDASKISTSAHPTEPTGPVSAAPGPTAATAATSSTAITSAPTPTSAPSQPDSPATPSPVTGPMEETARAFILAWAGHDARPGQDTSYDDASRRAADYAAGELAKDLSTRTSGSAGAQEWLRLKAGQIRVTATVLRVSLPDGAPAPTENSGFARVLYKVTEQPATGPSTEAERHLALKLQPGDDGVWRVVGLPNV